MQITDQHVSRFARLFTGFPDRHGRFTIHRDQPPGSKVEGTAHTEQGPPSVADWRAHLEGKQGIGIVPLMPDDSVHFAAIDVDTYDTPDGWHADIARRLRHLPLTCTESKSGGMHVWLHSFEGMPAKLAVDFLKKVRAGLGLPDAREIFPKQITRHSKDDVGNWINLPAFGDARRVVWFGEQDGKLSPGPRDLDSFLALAERNAELATPAHTRDMLRELRSIHATNSATGDDLPELQDGPPCLQRRLYGDAEARSHYRKLRKEGRLTDTEARELQAKCAPDCPQGTRNVVLFNHGVYLAKRHHGNKDTVEHQLQATNDDRKIGLDTKEIETIARSVTRKTYHFQCNDPALAEYCDRERCRLRKHGIGAFKPSLDAVSIENVRVLTTSPPVFVFDVEGVTVTATPDELTVQKIVRSKILAATKRLPAPMPEAKYAEWLSGWTETAIEVEPPPGADFASNVRDMLLLFVDEASERTGSDERFFIGRVLHRDNEAWFSLRYFKKFMQRDGMRPKERALTEALTRIGCTSRRTTIAKKTASPWIADPAKLRAQI